MPSKKCVTKVFSSAPSDGPEDPTCGLLRTTRPILHQASIQQCELKRLAPEAWPEPSHNFALGPARIYVINVHCIELYTLVYFFNSCDMWNAGAGIYKCGARGLHSICVKKQERSNARCASEAKCHQKSVPQRYSSVRTQTVSGWSLHLHMLLKNIPVYTVLCSARLLHISVLGPAQNYERCIELYTQVCFLLALHRTVYTGIVFNTCDMYKCGARG